MTDTSKEAVERMATGYEEGSGDSFRATAAMLRALLLERDTAFNAGIEAAAKYHNEMADHFLSEHSRTEESNPSYSRNCYSLYAQEVIYAVDIRALAKGE